MTNRIAKKLFKQLTRKTAYDFSDPNCRGYLGLTPGVIRRARRAEIKARCMRDYAYMMEGVIERYYGIGYMGR